ncbi:hypothetical protein Halhy_6558 (plasmid) [Haliscomenobacter hydrossis DSM 1100]|uniref:Uncharacterized protein n=1 Tax=Haliscomenobacter hydrossis (strain ATCC 27775 / DSM 1100 / LMG 10767 / O) TaxID=760192 RepID=F4L7L6_HALH1|nr:hypothetical protein Halhy_6558 [Haliscomenobacter hydrossis DSM 1100]
MKTHIRMVKGFFKSLTIFFFRNWLTDFIQTPVYGKAIVVFHFYCRRI